MNNDPIVNEVRTIRDDLARRFDYDIHAIFADLRARESASETANPLVKNAPEWAEIHEEAPAVREEPSRGGK